MMVVSSLQGSDTSAATLKTIVTGKLLLSLSLLPPPPCVLLSPPQQKPLSKDNRRGCVGMSWQLQQGNILII